MMAFRSALRSTAFALAVLASAATAQAADTSPDDPLASWKGTIGSVAKMKPAEIMHMMDTSHDGYVTREEFMKLQEQVFRNTDRNHDARLSADEFNDKQPSGG
jgi:predicted outer membrane protein